MRQYLLLIANMLDKLVQMKLVLSALCLLVLEEEVKRQRRKIRRNRICYLSSHPKQNTVYQGCNSIREQPIINPKDGLDGSSMC